MPPIVTPEEFVSIWQRSANLSEVAQRAGLTYRAASMKGHLYRKQGVPLKRFPGAGAPRGVPRPRKSRPRPDWPALIQLAHDLAPKPEGETK